MKLDDLDLFASGPSDLRAGTWERRLLRRGLPGLDGECVLDFGLRGRPLHQAGRLQAPDAAALHALADAIAAFQDGRPHTLTDNHGRSREGVLLVRFEAATPVALGRGAWMDYRIEYLQLP